MNIRMKIKEAFEKSGKNVSEVAEETGIDIKYLRELSKNKIPVNEILLDEAIILAQSLDLEITELYEIEPFEIKGIGKI